MSHPTSTSAPRHPPRSPRGYLLIKVMVASGILAITLGAVIGQLAAARVEVSAAAHRATAASLARHKLDHLFSMPHTVADGQQQEDFVAVPGHPQLRWKWSVAATPGVFDKSNPPLPSANFLHEITVTVDYPTGTRGKRRTIVLKRYRSA